MPRGLRPNRCQCAKVDGGLFVIPPPTRESRYPGPCTGNGPRANRPGSFISTRTSHESSNQDTDHVALTPRPLRAAAGDVRIKTDSRGLLCELSQPVHLLMHLRRPVMQRLHHDQRNLRARLQPLQLSRALESRLLLGCIGMQDPRWGQYGGADLRAFRGQRRNRRDLLSRRHPCGPNDSQVQQVPLRETRDAETGLTPATLRRWTTANTIQAIWV